MKIGILTLTDGSNYGNRLQNYALQKTLEKLGYDVETIKRTTFRDLSRKEKRISILKDTVKRLIGKKNTSFWARKRKVIFDEFNEAYINFSEDILHNNMAPSDMGDKYDYFVCGSDQIWNARYEIVSEDIGNHLAHFAQGKKRIAYAASFGTTDIAPGYENIFEKELKKFKSIGLRETSGVNIVKKYADRDDAVVVLDPTMLLKKEEWVKIERKPQYITDTPYIVTYFLGGRDKETTEYIQLIADNHNATIINLESEFLCDGDISKADVYLTGPDEFIWLVHNAKCVITDSFHATVFSILFHKPFAVCQRKSAEKENNVETRIDTLLTMFSLCENKIDVSDLGCVPHDYDGNQIERVLDRERQRSIEFLDDSLR